MSFFTTSVDGIYLTLVVDLICWSLFLIKSLLCKPHFFHIYAGGKFKLGARANWQSIANIPGENTKCTTDLLLNGSLDYEVSAEYPLMVRLTDNHVRRSK